MTLPHGYTMKFRQEKWAKDLPIKRLVYKNQPKSRRDGWDTEEKIITFLLFNFWELYIIVGSWSIANK